MKCILILVLQITYFNGYYSTNKSALQILLQGQKSRITKRSLSDSNNNQTIVINEAIQRDLINPLEIMLPKKKLPWKRHKLVIGKRRNSGELAKHFPSLENIVLKRDISDVYKDIKRVSADNKKKLILKDSSNNYKNDLGAERTMYYRSENLLHYKS